MWTASVVALLLLATVCPYAHAHGAYEGAGHGPCELCLIASSGALLLPATVALCACALVGALAALPVVPMRSRPLRRPHSPRGPPSS